MILSKNQLLSDAQAITADAASTNYIDLGAPGTPPFYNQLPQDVGKGTPVPLLVQVVEDFNNLTDLTISLQVDNDSAFGSPKTVHSETIALAGLTAGKRIALQHLPNGIDERYMRLFYDVNGTAPTTGKVTAGISMGNQTNS